MNAKPPNADAPRGNPNILAQEVIDRLYAWPSITRRPARVQVA